MFERFRVKPKNTKSIAEKYIFHVEFIINKAVNALIIIGNAPSEHIDYGDSQMTITQNTAGDIVFVNEENEVHIYTTNEISNKPICLYSKNGKENIEDEDGNVIYYYTGTLVV